MNVLISFISTMLHDGYEQFGQIKIFLNIGLRDGKYQNKWFEVHELIKLSHKILSFWQMSSHKIFNESSVPHAVLRKKRIFYLSKPSIELSTSTISMAWHPQMFTPKHHRAWCYKYYVCLLLVQLFSFACYTFLHRRTMGRWNRSPMIQKLSISSTGYWIESSFVRADGNKRMLEHKCFFCHFYEIWSFMKLFHLNDIKF